jgi:hypothetical protein
MGMEIINELYKPTHLMLPIGGKFTMGPEEAAYALKKFFSHAHTIFPMHFGTYAFLPGTQAQFAAMIEKYGVLDKHIYDGYTDALGKWITLKM